jgi:hypothetical protein
MSETQFKKAGRKLNEVWDFFEQTPLKSLGHYSAKCTFCSKSWKRAYVNALQAHLANDCLQCPEDVKSYYLGFLSACDDYEMETRGSKRLKRTGQQGIGDFYESKELPEHKVQAINNALIKAFVCCGISFSIIDNPFFRELLYQLRPNYVPPSRKVLSGSMLNHEAVIVNNKMKKELGNMNNLTLGKYASLYYKVVLKFKLIIIK